MQNDTHCPLPNTQHCVGFFLLMLHTELLTSESTSDNSRTISLSLIASSTLLRHVSLFLPHCTTLKTQAMISFPGWIDSAKSHYPPLITYQCFLHVAEVWVPFEMSNQSSKQWPKCSNLVAYYVPCHIFISFFTLPNGWFQVLTAVVQ